MKHDVVIVGSGLAGLRAAIELCKSLDVAIVSKLYPSRSHSGAAQGGIAAAVGNENPDDSPDIHMYDTVKGSDFLGDQDAIQMMCDEAPETVFEMERFGCVFSRDKDQKIAQRAFGGHSKKRSCYAADRTGHALLHVLFEQNMKYKKNLTMYNEYYLLELIYEEGSARGVVIMDMKTGKIEVIHAKVVIFATGGYGRAWKITSNAYSCTGDGIVAAYRKGIPLEDMEFVQFHPTGLYIQGILVSEAARGDGGYLINGKGERFMENYAPSKMELAPRDIVSRSEQTEINEGRGGEGKDFVYIDLRHLGREKILERLPQIRQLGIDFVGIDCIEKPLPIQPTAHYSMGGIPTNVNCEVLLDPTGTKARGFYAAGECSCISVHGANRLGTNSLLEATLFGRRAGKTALEYGLEAKHEPIDEEKERKSAEDRIKEIFNSSGKESTNDIRNELKDTMQIDCGVYRNEEGLKRALAKVRELRQRFKNARVTDQAGLFNTEIIEAMELRNMLEFSEVIVTGAIARPESRGAHSRTDFPKRDDDDWMKHTFAFRQADESIDLKYKPVVVTKHQPEERKY